MRIWFFLWFSFLYGELVEILPPDDDEELDEENRDLNVRTVRSSIFVA